MYAFPFISFPTFWYSSSKYEEYIKQYTDKYLGGLSDAEIDDFESYYKQARQMYTKLWLNRSNSNKIDVEIVYYVDNLVIID